jgi:hypothetical protein
VNGVVDDNGGATSSTFGAYGLVVPGLPDATPWMQPQAANAPVFDVEVDVVDEGTYGPSTLSATCARVHLIGGGLLSMESHRSRAHFRLPFRPPDEELLHPYLAPAAALYWQWNGREALHAGVFCQNNQAVLLLGDKEAGKSTTLSWLATQDGVHVLSDDLAIVQNNVVMTGPRSIDLRANAAGTAAPGRPVRGDRHRVTLPPAPDAVPIVGLAYLAWTSREAFTPVALRERMEILGRHRTFPSLAADPVALLDLASLPMVTAGRPKIIDALDPFGRGLLDHFGG